MLTEIDHVAIAVRDLEAAIEYYAKAFGATVDHREVVESDGVEEALLQVADLHPDAGSFEAWLRQSFHRAHEDGGAFSHSYLR